LPTLPAFAQTTVIDNGSSGFYNDQIGTVLDGTDHAFPIPYDDDDFYTYDSAPNISAAAAILGNWLTDPTNLNGNWQSGAIPTSWDESTEFAVIYALDASGNDNFTLDIGADNGVFVWLDGQYLFGARDYGGGSEFEYSVDLGQLTAGEHYLQLLYEDHGGQRGFNINVAATAVPEPAIAAMLLAGLGLVGSFARRKSVG
jgi:hypothetical protein